MPTERAKMLAGELYDPMDPDLVAARERARDLCQSLNATPEAEQDERRRILRDLFAAGGDTVWMQPPFYCDYGSNIAADEFDRWSFSFANDGAVVAECPWRLVGSDGILISSADHRQQYGRPAPIDCAAELLQLLHDRRVAAVTIVTGTLDLTIGFEQGPSLEIVPFSIGYEAWQTFSPTGFQVIAQGRGQLSGFWFAEKP